MNSSIVSEVSRPVSCPFQTYLGAGKSKFSVSIPRQFLTCTLPNSLQPAKRKFYYTHLRVIPDFYSRDAYLFNLDTAEDLAVRLNYDFGIFYYPAYDLYPTPVDYPKDNAPGLKTFFPTVNRWSVSIKPTNLVKPPFFIDWIDTDLTDRTEEILGDGNDWQTVATQYGENSTLLYYGEDYDPGKHINALPSQFRSVPFANNFLFPTEAGVDRQLLDRLRIRIVVAPNTRIYFSSKKMLQMLGFDAQRRAGSRLGFVNREPDKYQYFVAEEYPLVNQIMEAGRITVTPAADSSFVTRSVAFTPKEKRSNEDLWKNFKAVLESVSKETNVEFGLNFGKASGLFAFQWPSNRKINVEMSGDPELFQRLGFGLVGGIDKNSASTEFKIGDKESASKSKILCFDTGQVVVTCQNTSSNLTSISNNEYLNSLLPMGIGVLEMPTLQQDFVSVVPPAFEGGQEDTVPFNCRLWKFDDTGKMVPFNWTVGSVVSGVLRGNL